MNQTPLLFRRIPVIPIAIGIDLLLLFGQAKSKEKKYLYNIHPPAGGLQQLWLWYTPCSLRQHGATSIKVLWTLNKGYLRTFAPDEPLIFHSEALFGF